MDVCMPWCPVPANAFDQSGKPGHYSGIMRPANDQSWIRATLRHEDTGSVPYQFMLSPVAQEKLCGHYGPDLATRLRLPLRMSSPKSIKPLYADPRQFGPSAVDEFGVVWSTSPIDRGSPIGPSIHEPDLSRYRFPPVDLDYRFEDLGEWSRKEAAHFRIIWVGDLWERATFMRGMEDLLMDVVLNRDFVRGLLRGLADRILATMAILFDRFEFEGIAVSDDYGSQRSLMISPPDWRELVKPLLAEIYGLAKSRGKVVFHHTCGHVVPIIGDLIDIGLDILHPIQPEAMDILALKRDFGDHLTFCGGIPTQHLLVQGTPEQVRAEVRRLKRAMGRGGGYILEPGITLQADVPLINMIAMIDEAMDATV